MNGLVWRRYRRSKKLDQTQSQENGMGKLKDTLCNISKKQAEKHRDEMDVITGTAKFVCKDCDRTAIKKKWLCKPKKNK